MAGRKGLGQAYRRLYAWANRRLYRELAWAYEVIAWVVSLGHWDAWRAQVLDYVKGERVLELGFGTGALLAEATRRGTSVVGVDPSRAMQRVAARRLRRAGAAVPRVRARAQALPFASGCFDTALSAFPTNYIADPETLAEVARVLAPETPGCDGGRLVVTGVGFEADRPRYRRWLGWIFGGVPSGEAEDTVAAYGRHADRLGFDVRIKNGRDTTGEQAAHVWVPVVILEPRRNGGER